jgi:kumamolisin
MIRKFPTGVFVCLLAVVLFPRPDFAQVNVKSVSRFHVVNPNTSPAVAASSFDAGTKARTHLRILVSSTGANFGGSAQPSELPPFPDLAFETPASLGCIYHLVHHSLPGCNPNATTENPNVGKGANAIALIEGFDYPTAASDLAVFDAQFGLPTANLTVKYVTGVEPPVDPTGNFTLEAGLDLEWAHAMAPQAQLFLVEAPNDDLLNLFKAAQFGAALVASAGGGEVSMSFGADGEGSNEADFDGFFVFPGVVFFASAGDSPGPDYPSASPNVVSAGGTSISRSQNTGDFLFENSWQDAGGGPSAVEPRPPFQNGVAFIVGNSRGTPDLSFDANPTTGVWIYNSNPVFGTGWFVVGGTSVSAPSLAGIVNAAGGFRTSSQTENQQLYNSLFTGAFNDTSYGSCGIYNGNFAIPGYDFCTGVGTTNTLRDK